MTLIFLANIKFYCVSYTDVLIKEFVESNRKKLTPGDYNEIGIQVM